MELNQIDQQGLQDEITQEYPQPKHPRQDAHIPRAISDVDARMMREAIAQSGFTIGTGERHQWR